MNEPCAWCHDTGLVGGDPNEIYCDCGRWRLQPAGWSMLEFCVLRRMMLTLAGNLRVAGALCEAWRLGWNADAYALACETYWAPGCGHPAPETWS